MTYISITPKHTSINVKDYNAKGNLIYSIPTYETVTRVSGNDDTLAIQTALNYAGSLVSSDVTREFEGQSVCFIPEGNYYISQTLIVPPNVVLHCEGMLFNFIEDISAPVVHGSRHSHCRKLSVHANAKSGVTWGDASAGSSPCASDLEKITIWHVGVNYLSNEPINRQKAGLRLHGLDFRCGFIWIKGGNIGLHLSVASDVLAANVFLIGCSTGLVMESCEQIELPSVRWDTNINQAAQIDNSNNTYINGRAFVNSNSYGTPMQNGIVLGKYSTNICKHIHINYEAQSTGGYGIDISNAEDCKFILSFTNSRNFAQTSGNGSATSHWVPTSSGALLAHNIGTTYFYNSGNPIEQQAAAVKYGSSLNGYINIEVSKSSNINLSEGTVFGILKGF